MPSEALVIMAVALFGMAFTIHHFRKDAKAYLEDTIIKTAEDVDVVLKKFKKHDVEFFDEMLGVLSYYSIRKFYSSFPITLFFAFILSSFYLFIVVLFTEQYDHITDPLTGNGWGFVIAKMMIPMVIGMFYFIGFLGFYKVMKD